MTYKKITSALMALTMAASMTAVSVNAEDTENPEQEPVVIETQAPAPVETEAPAPVETAAPAPVETEAPAPVETASPVETEAPAPIETASPVETEAPATAASATDASTEGTQTTAESVSSTTETAATTATEKETAATTAESINKNIATPKLGDFIITNGESSSSAVISWTAVEGATGYEIQLVQTPSGGKATSTSIPSTTKTAFQFDFGKDPLKATVKVRALKDGEKGAWAERTVYLNGMKPEETKAATTATNKSTTKKQETTTTKKTETGKTESPKTADSANIPAVAGAAAAALLAGVAVQRKKK